MLLHSPLSTVTPTVEADVLRILARADAEFTVQALARMIEHRSPEGIRRALDRLVEQGVVARRSLGRAHGYTLNRSHLASPAIIALANLDIELHRRIRDRVGGWQVKPVYAAIFGSGARGEMRADSDIDLAFVFDGAVTDRMFDEISSLAADITAWTGNDTRPLIIGGDEFREGIRSDRVLSDIARDAIPLFGEAQNFRRLVGA